MTRWLPVRAAPLWLLLLINCSQTPITLPLRSLERSGDVAFVCATPEGAGRPLGECPSADGVDRRLLGLVTQTKRGEVAVIDLSAGRVVDVDPSIPGFSFLPTGADPRAIVATPGGVATFVGVAEPGKEGLYALPTTCARAPAHDLTSFPACALPVAPGAMLLMIDPPNDAGLTRETCASSYDAGSSEVGVARAASGRECTADLATELVPAGRRKLVVALPSLGELAVFDAQRILDASPGSFDPCQPEYTLPLRVELPAPIDQQLPADLAALPGCTDPVGGASAPQQAYLPRPSDFSLAQGKLYVADLDAPVLHVLDAATPCALSEQPPLLPASFADHDRIVTTTAVAVSPATTRGERFAYAVDADDGSAMVFDVTPGSAQRTPIVRSGAPRLPYEAPDRIAFSTRAHDVELALRDVPVPDPDTGVALLGEACDPSPSLATESSGATFRTAADYASGASPHKLRGVFAFLALASGQVAVIDIEDFDAPCRRPTRTNRSAEPDFRGCADGTSAALPGYFTDDGAASGRRTVSGEVSCNIVEPHRSRASTFAVNDDNVGVRAPTLRTLPRLSVATLGAVPTDTSEEGKKHPKLLAVPYAHGEPPELYVGSSFFSNGDDDTGNDLDLSPTTASDLSLTLVLNEPRAFAPQEDTSIVYEGAITSQRTSGIVRADGTFPDNVGYCDLGVQDEDIARSEAARLGVAATAVDDFAARHADYVQLTGAVLPSDDPWWKTDVGKSCGGAGDGFSFCDQTYGTTDAPTTERDFTIVEAYSDRLLVAARGATAADSQTKLQDVACCFPARTAYTIRAGQQWIVRGSASGFRHDIDHDGGGRCVRSCDPRRVYQKSRAYEILVAGTDPANPTPDDGACVVKSVPVDQTSPCVFENLTLRYAVYRGAEASERDMTFDFIVTGGYYPLTANIAGSNSSVLPERLMYVPQLGQLAVVDGGSAGLSLLSLTSLSASNLYF